jgi:hypothetical protein
MYTLIYRKNFFNFSIQVEKFKGEFYYLSHVLYSSHYAGNDPADRKKTLWLLSTVEYSACFMPLAQILLQKWTNVHFLLSLEN